VSHPQNWWWSLLEPAGVFKVPHDLIPKSYTSEPESETKHSAGKSLAKKALGAAVLSVTVKSRGQSPLLLGAGGYAGGSLMSSSSTTTKENMRVNLQFNDKSIFSGVLKPKEWQEFDNFFQCYDYPNHVQYHEVYVKNLNEEVDNLREQFAAADGKEQKEITRMMKIYKKELVGVEKKHKVITKMAKKAKTLP